MKKIITILSVMFISLSVYANDIYINQSGATLDLDIDGTNNYIEMNNDIDVAAGDFIPFSDITDNVVRKTTFSDIPLSIMDNDAGFTSNTGDITAVTAGTGLSGGGTSGGVTINVDYAGSDNIILASGTAATGTLSTSDVILVSLSLIHI